MSDSGSRHPRALDEEPYGMKAITPENLSSIDPVLGWIGLPVDPGPHHETSRRAFIGSILKIELDSAVPVELRKLFLVARGTLCYGLFFYPLFDLGFEQLLRIADLAAKRTCEDLGAPAKIDKFKKRIKFLADRGLLAQYRWDAIRDLRNLSSHPNDQTIRGPSIIDTFARITNDINALFLAVAAFDRTGAPDGEASL